jgi:predicted metal-binding membrane protein
MDRMDAMGGMDASGSTGSYVLVAAMWSAMMVAMMVPSAAPTILLYARVHRHGPGGSIPPTAAFLAGYVGCWLGFAVVAAALQLWLEQAALASPMTMTLHSRTAAGGLLIAAGLYQLSPLKDACLSRCRSPAEFLTRHFRPGPAGALRLGMLHGGYCIGCCWMLMALLFVGGVMNLVWIAALTLLVAAEKLLPGGARVALIAGVSMILWGVVLLAT